MKIYIVSPEDLLLSKLYGYRNCKVLYRLEDIKIFVEIEKILTRVYLQVGFNTLKLNTFDTAKK